MLCKSSHFSTMLYSASVWASKSIFEIFVNHCNSFYPSPAHRTAKTLSDTKYWQFLLRNVKLVCVCVCVYICIKSHTGEYKHTFTVTRHRFLFRGDGKEKKRWKIVPVMMHACIIRQNIQLLASWKIYSAFSSVFRSFSRTIIKLERRCICYAKIWIINRRMDLYSRLHYHCCRFKLSLLASKIR